MKWNAFDITPEQKALRKEKLEALKGMLFDHDWYFEYSDDFKAWEKGFKERRLIKKTAFELGIEIYEAAFEAFQNDKLKEFVEADL